MDEEYIDREAALRAILGQPPDAHYPGWYADSIKGIPAADVATVVHSKWEICCDGYYPYCKNCGEEPKSGKMTKFCPKCGAKMDGGSKRGS